MPWRPLLKKQIDQSFAGIARITTYLQVETICLMLKTARSEDIFRAHGGQLRMSEAIRHGLSRYTLYALKEHGAIEQISRGLYRLADLPPIGNPDLVTVSLRCPHAVICLVSALSWHGITTQIPHAVPVAVPRDARAFPRSTIPRSSRIGFRMRRSKPASRAMTSMACQSVSTMPRSRSPIASSSATRSEWTWFWEALQLYRQRKRSDPGKLVKYAKVCRVENVMRPYLEAIS